MAQVRSANGLRGIFKFSEILGSISYVFPSATKSIDIKIRNLYFSLLFCMGMKPDFFI